MIDSLKNSFQNIKKNKLLFTFLILLQLLLIAGIVFVIWRYAPLFLDQLAKISEAMQASPVIQGDLSAIYDGQLGIAEGLKTIGTIIFKSLFFFYLLYVFLIGTSWFISSKISTKQTKYSRYIPAFAFLFLSFFLLNFILIYFLTKILLTLNLLGSLKVLIPIIILITSYFMYISFSLIGKYKLKKLIKQTVLIGSKNLKTLVPAYIFLIIPIILFFIVIIFTYSTINLGLLTLILIFLLIAMNWSRIYFLVKTEEVNY